MLEFWNKEYTEICDGIAFKFKKCNPVELINLATTSIEYEKLSFEKQNQFIAKCLAQILWNKDGVNWYPLTDEDGNARLPELQNDPTLGFDLFMMFKSDVILPVFTESRTFRNLTSQHQGKSPEHHN